MIAALLVAGLSATAAPSCPGADWAHWDRYAQAFISSDGRVVDHTAGDRTTSEGQAYGLFFALVANDRALFERVLHWTESNLARGSLRNELPAWLWGKDKDGSWHVLDQNSASDADLWMAYALVEAGRLWKASNYTQVGRGLAARIVDAEVANLPGLGPMLLPGPVGFELVKKKEWRLNASYLPPQLLRRLASAKVPGPWSKILKSTVKLITESAPNGLVPDWSLYHVGQGVLSDPETGSVGSYDAIRVYLWAGMLESSDPLRSELSPATRGLWSMVFERGQVPEKVDVLIPAKTEGSGPPGFAAALLPESKARGDQTAVLALEQRIESSLANGLYGTPPAYYDQNLILFARGYASGWFRFARDGRVEPRWTNGCTSR